jgi:hypothetical protein
MEVEEMFILVFCFPPGSLVMDVGVEHRSIRGVMSGPGTTGRLVFRGGPVCPEDRGALSRRLFAVDPMRPFEEDNHAPHPKGFSR